MSEVLLAALTKKRAELYRRIEADTQAIASINVVLALYEEPEPERVGRSGLTRLIFDAMRGAPDPLTIRQIAASVAAAKGAPEDAQRFVSRTERVLYRLRLRGVVESVQIGGVAKGWRIVAKPPSNEPGI
jgi:hypothetical protein